MQATNALCLACFITCSDEEISGDILQLMEAIFSSTSEGVKATDDVKVRVTGNESNTPIPCSTVGVILAASSSPILLTAAPLYLSSPGGGGGWVVPAGDRGPRVVHDG